jgi:hypothetical protein
MVANIFGTFPLQHIPRPFVSEPIRLPSLLLRGQELPRHLSYSVAFRDISQRRASVRSLWRRAHLSSHATSGPTSSTAKERFPGPSSALAVDTPRLVFCPAIAPSTIGNDSTRPFPFPPYILLPPYIVPGLSLFLSPPTPMNNLIAARGTLLPLPSLRTGTIPRGHLLFLS